MKRILTTKEMKRAEDEANTLRGMRYFQMAENAAAATHRMMHEKGLLPQGRETVILCGKGNNGADGYLLSVRLQEEGRKVSVIAAETPASVLCIQAMQQAQQHGVAITSELEVPKGALVVDAVYGTGFRGGLEPRIHTLFDRVRAQNHTVVALDVPSGIHADSGSVAPGTLCADFTAAFCSEKPAHFLKPSRTLCGAVSRLDIGIEMPGGAAVWVYETVDFLEKFPARACDCNKGDFGRLLNFSGSEGMSGAALISSRAALRSGVGLAVLCSDPQTLSAARCSLPEVMTCPRDEGEFSLRMVEGADAILIGCGMGKSAQKAKFCEMVLEQADCPVVIDADGINMLADNIDMLRHSRGQFIITPHPKEMARLMQVTVETVLRDRISAARDFALSHNVTLVLKTASTVTALPNGEVIINTTGNPGLAKGGSGDVLAGMIASLCAQGLSPRDAAAAGVWLHGRAADLAARRTGKAAMLATDLIEVGIPEALRELER